jgi:hypothetical protein
VVEGAGWRAHSVVRPLTSNTVSYQKGKSMQWSADMSDDLAALRTLQLHGGWTTIGATRQSCLWLPDPEASARTPFLQLTLRRRAHP